MNRHTTVPVAISATALTAAVLTAAVAFAGPAAAHPDPAAGTYTIAVWRIPAWAGPTRPTWPQTLTSATGSDHKTLTVALPDGCGAAYQIDAYLTRKLPAAGLPATLHRGQDAGWFDGHGGWGTNYTLVRTAACTSPSPTPTPSTSTPASSTPAPTPTSSTPTSAAPSTPAPSTSAASTTHTAPRPSASRGIGTAVSTHRTVTAAVRPAATSRSLANTGPQTGLLAGIAAACLAAGAALLSLTRRGGSHR